MYNGFTNTWTLGAKLNDGRYGHVMCAVGDALYVLGGRVTGDHCVTSIERCNIDMGQFETIGKLPAECFDLSAAVVGDNYLNIDDY
jgi:hypothetical protein